MTRKRTDRGARRAQVDEAKGLMLTGVAGLVGVVVIEGTVAYPFADAVDTTEVVLSTIAAPIIILIASVFVAAVAAPALWRAVDAWTGVMSGRVPVGFGPGSFNSARATADLVIGALTAAAGIAGFRAGLASAEVGWSVLGLLTAAFGLGLGVATGLARWRLSRLKTGRHSRPNAPKASQARSRRDLVTVYAGVSVAALGISLGALGGLQASRAASGDLRMAYGQWTDTFDHTALEFSFQVSKPDRVVVIEALCGRRAVSIDAPAQTSPLPPATLGLIAESGSELRFWAYTGASKGDTFTIGVAAGKRMCSLRARYKAVVR